MRLLLCTVASIAACLCVTGVRAQEATGEGFHGGEARKDTRQVRVEVLMVAAPQALALEILPELKDAAKIEAATEKLLAAVKRKQAVLTGYPTLKSLPGTMAITQDVQEVRYASYWDIPSGMAAAAKASMPDAPFPGSVTPVPHSFETRNVGVTLQADSSIRTDSDLINLNIVCNRVMLQGYKEFEIAKYANGSASKIELPRFAVSTVTTSVIARSGQRCLLAVNNAIEPPDHLEFFILRAVIEKPGD